MTRKSKLILMTASAIVFMGGFTGASFANNIASAPTQQHATVVKSARKVSHKHQVRRTYKRTVVKTKKFVKKYWRVPLSRDLQSYINKLCKQYGVSERLAYGEIETESNFDPNKISSTNDYGLFQINGVNRPWLADKLRISNWFDAYQNSKAGIYMLGQLTKKYHYQNLVSMAYNEGEGGMLHTIRHGIWSTTYSRKVLSNMSGLQQG